MPRSVFTCKSLVSLTVKTDYLTFSLPETAGCCFPNLKFLHYSSGYDSDRASRENLFRSCPLLEELTIEAHHEKDVLNFNISAPELRKLTTVITEERGKYWGGYCDECYSEKDSKAEPCNFLIDAPKLEDLCVAGMVMSKYRWENSNSLVQAKVQLQDFEEASTDRVAEFIHIISSVRYMTISVPVFEPYLPHAFSNLIKLELVFYEKSQTTIEKWLAEVLNKSPNLESLVLDFSNAGARASRHRPEFVPTCLNSKLKTISIKGFRGTPNEMGVAKFLLRYGKVLDKVSVIVSSASCSRTGGAKEEILSFEKGSKTCQVDFI